MRDVRIKLAVLAATAVVATMLAAAIAFNLFIGWQVEREAVGDIAYTFSLDDEATSTGRTPNYLLLDSSFAIGRADRRLATDKERSLAEWFSKNPQVNVIHRVSLGNWTCYAAVFPAADYEGDATDGYYMAYIDVASEQSLIATVNTAFVIIGVVGALGAAAAGNVAGRRIFEAQESQKRFYENMSHDLKTPLAAIGGYAEGAARGLVDTSEATRAIRREVEGMTETINEMLSLSRLEAGAVRLSREPVAVEDFVQDCLMPLEGAVRTKGIDVALDLAPGEVQADVALFDHALSNVLINAVRHAATYVRVRYDGASLSVWNDGGAPPPDQIPHLFERFHVGEGGSTGVGLAIAREVATLHGWTVGAQAVGEGLEVRFVF